MQRFNREDWDGRPIVTARDRLRRRLHQKPTFKQLQAEAAEQARSDAQWEGIIDGVELLLAAIAARETLRNGPVPGLNRAEELPLLDSS